MPYVFLSDQQADPVEPVWSAGSVSWDISSTGLDCDDFLFSVAYFVFSVASYSAAGAKEAVQVGVDVMFVLFVALVAVPFRRRCQSSRALFDPPADPVEPVWPAGLVGWCNLRMWVLLLPRRLLFGQHGGQRSKNDDDMIFISAASISKNSNKREC